MTQPIIQVENISKQYRIGARQDPYGSLRESVMNTLSAPFRRLSGHASPDYDTIWALKDVSFEVQPGEVVGIIGRNGAGKSTLLKILSRITKPTHGRAILRGRVASLLEVGTGFHPELTGRENIYLNGAILGMHRHEIERKFDEIVDFAEIEKFLDTPVKRYSSGMYVRLAFAVAAHLEPEVLVIDEVLAVGDAEFQKKCLGKMGQVAQGGRTVLFVSHNMGAIRGLCSTGLLVDKGQLLMQGPVGQVIHQYLIERAGASSAEVKLSLMPGSSPGVGRFLRFYNQSGKPQSTFQIFEPWQIELEFEMFEKVGHVIAAAGITTFESVPVATFWSLPRDLEPGRYCVRFQVDFPVTSTDFQFVVGLSSHGQTFYYMPNQGHVTISNVAQHGQLYRSSAATGLLATLHEVNIQKL